MTEADLPTMQRDHPIRRKSRLKIMNRLADHLKEKFASCIMNAKDTPDPIQYVSTGYGIIDDILSGERDNQDEIVPGTGKGFPRGRIIEVFGPEAAAKTTLGLMTIAAVQKQGGRGALIDVERAFNDRYATKVLGVDTHYPQFLHAMPDNAEEALELLKEIIKAKYDVVVLDSVSALVSKKELAGDGSLGYQAKLMSKTCRELTTMLKPDGPAVIFINQVRMKIGVLFQNPEFTSGGYALKFYSSVRVDLRKKKAYTKPSSIYKDEDVTTGIKIRMKVVKNKVAPEGGVCTFDINFSSGIVVPKRIKRKIKNEVMEDSKVGD